MEGNKNRKKKDYDDYDFFLGLEDYFEDYFRDIRQIFRDLMRDLMSFDEEHIQKLVKDPKAKVYGLSIRIGKDGKPIIKEFGNIKPSIEAIEEGKEELIGVREPLVEVQEHGDELLIIAEVPGVKKEDIKLIAYKDKLEIKVNTPERKYYKKINLPSEVEEDKIKANYNNGVLEVRLKVKKKETEKGKEIKVE